MVDIGVNEQGGVHVLSSVFGFIASNLQEGYLPIRRGRNDCYQMNEVMC